jgi:flap endonuclease-1
MGVDIKDLIEPKEIELESLTGKKIAIDALNTIYQFLSIIRQPDGTPLMDSKGRVTSHLSGLFYRTLRLLEMGIIPCYVFDGKPPQLKAETVKTRKKTRKKAKEKWEKALDKGDLAEARKFAQASSKVTEEMLEECKALLGALGIPSIQAPSEGESQAAFMCDKNEVYAVGSQDFDSLLFGASKLIRNMTITGRRKVPRKNFYVEIKPELLDLEKILSTLGITRENLIEIGIMVGTDFNPGIKGIGPKTALKHIQDKTFKDLEFSIDPEKIKEIFLKPEITKDYDLKWGDPDRDKLIEILHEKHEFSSERIDNALDKYERAGRAKDQKSLEDWV